MGSIFGRSVDTQISALRNDAAKLLMLLRGDLLRVERAEVDCRNKLRSAIQHSKTSSEQFSLSQCVATQVLAKQNILTRQKRAQDLVNELAIGKVDIKYEEIVAKYGKLLHTVNGQHSEEHAEKLVEQLQEESALRLTTTSLLNKAIEPTGPVETFDQLANEILQAAAAKELLVLKSDMPNVPATVEPALTNSSTVDTDALDLRLKELKYH